ncbi:hypothetical protein FACS1894166_10660 [Bacilli bacterium]|nr:hypothetical protein FACS1894166_10660 [Bacilli bacterium]
MQSNEINISEVTKSEFHKLKRKRIYFDFESLNLATRVIDNTVPFIQTVNQVSVIVDHGDGNIDNVNKQNIVIDPQDVTVESLEQIIDAIYPKSDAKNYSYVVYNKSFEKSRLTEMAEIINSQEYYDKVKVINENIYDLADFFDPRKD